MHRPEQDLLQVAVIAGKQGATFILGTRSVARFLYSLLLSQSSTSIRSGNDATR